MCLNHDRVHRTLDPAPPCGASASGKNPTRQRACSCEQRIPSRWCGGLVHLDDAPPDDQGHENTRHELFGLDNIVVFANALELLHLPVADRNHQSAAVRELIEQRCRTVW